jgi:hypothetical protein
MSIESAKRDRVRSGIRTDKRSRRPGLLRSLPLLGERAQLPYSLSRLSEQAITILPQLGELWDDEWQSRIACAQ